MNTHHLVTLALAVSLCACQKRSVTEEGLPPAVGEGVAAPEVPSVKALMGAAASAVPGGTSAIAGTGTLYPRTEAELGPKATGLLTAVSVNEGDRVRKGQVVFRLDDSHAALALRSAEAQLSAAKTQLRTATLEFDRGKELNARGSLPQAAFEQIQARRDGALDGVAQAEVAVSMAQRARADTVVTSPIAGVVTARYKDPGETVTLTPVSVVVVVQDVSVLELRVRLPEGVLKKLTEGAPLRMVVPAVDVEREIPVKRINPSVDVATRTVEVVADVDNADRALKPGMLVNVALAEAPEASRAGSGDSKEASAVPGRGAKP